MLSTMQDRQLGLPLLLRHAHRVNGKSNVISHGQSTRHVATFATVAERAGRLGSALERRGYPRGTVVGTFAGSTQEHLEAYLGVPASGRILHTLNVRLHDDHLEYIARHASDEIFIVDEPNLERFCSIAPRLPGMRLLIVAGKDAPDIPAELNCDVVLYEELLLNGTPEIDWPEIDEHEAAIICYTGGTTGLPKGVAYSHRSLWLQAMSLCTANAVGVGCESRLLPAVPLYHVNGWGLPFAALMAGADLIMPGHSMRAEHLLALIDEESPTIAAGVPTIWSDVLDLARAKGRADLGAVRTICCGGAQVSQSLSEAYRSMGIRMVQAWGMTETSSVSAVATVPPWAQSEEDRLHYQASQGRVVCGLEVRIAGLEGEVLPSDGTSVGEIHIRGPWVTGRYLGADDQSEFQDGWLRTGDLGTVDGDGYIFVADRAKDAVKSGGEWIPSLALEEAIRSHPAVQDVAVVAIPDSRWQERPGAVVVLRPGHVSTSAELSEWLRDKVARWWIPSLWIFSDSLPRTAVGKIDKRLIRQSIRDGVYS